MKAKVTHNLAVMQEITPATITLTMSFEAARAIAALLSHVLCKDLDQFNIPEELIPLLHQGRPLQLRNESSGGLRLYFHEK